MILKDDEADIWLASPEVVQEPAVRQRCESILEADELKAYRRYYFARDQDLYLTAHALTRTVLSSYAPIAPEAWRFRKNEYGRPEIEGEAALRFNISHTPGLVACLVVRAADAGVDVERRRKMSDLLAIAERFFSPDELEDLCRLPAQERHVRFFELWTLKEAYIKGRGMGLHLPLDGFSYRLGAQATLTVRPDLNDDGRLWQFGLATPTPEHQLAWAIRGQAGHSFGVTIRTFPAQALATR